MISATSDGYNAWPPPLLQDQAGDNAERAEFISAAVKGLQQADALRQRGPIGKGEAGRSE